MTIPALVRRGRERQGLLDRARRYADGIAPDLGVRAVVVFGSVARGDFNVWSDIDVLVVAEHLPTATMARVRVVDRDRPPRVAPVAWTPAELAARLRRRDPIAVEAYTRGIPVLGALPTR